MFGYMLYFTDAMRPQAPERPRYRTARKTSEAGTSSRWRILRSVLTIAAIGALLTTSAVAETTRMSGPNQKVSLHEGPVDMQAEWVLLDDGGYEVTARFIGRSPDAKPVQIVMKLHEGDDVSFSMPGHRTAVYRFARDQVGIWPMRIQLSSGVSASVEMTTNVYAAR